MIELNGVRFESSNRIILTHLSYGCNDGGGISIISRFTIKFRNKKEPKKKRDDSRNNIITRVIFSVTTADETKPTSSYSITGYLRLSNVP